MSIQEQKTKLNIGLFGFGVVGESLYKTLAQTPGLNAQIKKVCIRHRQKIRNAPQELFTTDASILLNDPDINVIVELIDDADAAYHIVVAALTNGKAVVSANKKMIAEHLPELIALQQRYNVPFLYEAACCASIPVIRNLEEYYDNDLLHGISGIVNGSTNYILTQITDKKISFAEALAQAQRAGFAESNPALDIEGVDAVNKLSILLVHPYGISAPPESLLHTGIHRLHAADAAYAREKGFEIKLVAQARKLKDGKIAAFVAPQFITPSNQLVSVKNEYNGVIIESSLADQQFFYGKGAGGLATASAVLSDLSALRYNYRYEYKKLMHQPPSQLAYDFCLKVYIGCDDLNKIPIGSFERVLSWSCGELRSNIVGNIDYSKLVGNNWWRNPDISLIVYPEGIIENQTQEKMRIHKLETAGMELG